jgi:hypothetical protein
VQTLRDAMERFSNKSNLAVNSLQDTMLCNIHYYATFRKIFQTTSAPLIVQITLCRYNNLIAAFLSSNELYSIYA